MRFKRINTTLDPDLAEIAKNKGISWARALEVGIKTLLRVPFFEEKGIKIVKESEISKKERAMVALQEHIDNLNDEIDKLKGGAPDERRN